MTILNRKQEYERRVSFCEVTIKIMQNITDKELRILLINKFKSMFPDMPASFIITAARQRLKKHNLVYFPHGTLIYIYRHECIGIIVKG